ncbi:MAG TPA: redoxin domain-containing protein [Phycisphaerae bacterium]|nr:redoxin domain-containing protein [Phycisphaerae bacterium]
MNPMKLRWLCMAFLMAGLTLPTRADDEDEPDVPAILKAVDSATKALTEVSYDAEFHAEGENAEQYPLVKGKVELREAKKGLIGSMFGGGANLLHFKGKFQPPGSEEELQFESACDGKNVYAIDFAQEVFTQGKYPEASRILAPGLRLYMQEYVHATPFSDEINAKSAKHESVKKVGDVECDVIYVVYSEGVEARWFFGKKDHLPRRVERMDFSEEGELKAALILVVKNLDTKPGLSDAAFRLDAPEGYKSKEFEAGGGEAAALLPKGSAAPDWELKTAEGETVSLTEQKGKVVVLAFWATHSGPSKLSMPGIQKLHDEFKSKPVLVWGVNCWESRDPVQYMKKKGYTFGLLMDGDKVADKYRLNNLPAFYVIDGEGKIAYGSLGFLKDKDKELAKAVEEALKKGKS